MTMFFFKETIMRGQRSDWDRNTYDKTTNRTTDIETTTENA